MAHSTSSPFVYDCGTCAKPVFYNNLGWFHSDRHVTCEIVSVVEVPLRKPSPATVENLELVA